MKRRTFLRLSSAALAALGLSACGRSRSPASTPASSRPSSDSEADQIVDDVDDTAVDIGLTLEEAKAFSDQNNRPFFILRSNGEFYPLFTPSYRGTMVSPYYHDISTALMVDCITYQESFPYGDKHLDPLTDNFELLDGDQLVYISSGSIRDHFDIMDITSSFYTLPVIFKCGDPTRSLYPDKIQSIDTFSFRRFSDYDPSYIPSRDSADSILSVSSLSNLTINGLSVQEYCDSHEMIRIFYTEQQSAYDNTVTDYNFYYAVDLTDFTSFDPQKAEKGILELTEENSENTVVIGYYEGTEYHSLTLKANCLAVLHDSSPAYTCPLSLTQNGYAVIDTSSLPSGDYAIGSAPDIKTQDYTLTTAYGFLSIP